MGRSFGVLGLSKQKAGAEVLFNDPDVTSTSVGVTVAPVRVKSLAAFGSTDEVAQKLLAAERNKVCAALARYSCIDIARR